MAWPATRAPRREVRLWVLRDLYDDLKSEAEEQRRTINAQIEVILTERYGEAVARGEAV